METIRAISELIVYGEQNDQDVIFDYFCEKNMLALLTDMIKAPFSTATVQTQIIQTLAILVQNVRNDVSLFYLLSNNYINEVPPSPSPTRPSLLTPRPGHASPGCCFPAADHILPI